MKYLLTILTFAFSIFANAQLCPGGGTDYASAVTFDAAWVYGCLTGTSCNGGTNFDNRAACEPDPNVDPCAPQPTGSTASRLGSDLWYRFVAPDTTATINVIKNVSLMAAIQAFSDPGNCAGLVELGVAYSVNPSGPVTLVLNSLIIGDTYVFRVFGHARPASQRTGVFCFCGSSGLFPSTVLPIKVHKFTTELVSQSTVNISWNYSNSYNFSHFELERKLGAGEFTPVAYFKPDNSNEISFNYTDILNSTSGDIQYRLKMVDLNGTFEYSDIRSVFRLKSRTYKVLNANQFNLNIFSEKIEPIEILTAEGKKVLSTTLKKGINNLSVSLSKGVYLIKDYSGGMQRMVVG